MENLYLKEILNMVSQGFMYPDMAILVLLLLYSVVEVGAIAVELVTERRHFRLVMPDFLNAVDAARPEDLPAVIDSSGLLRNQREVLHTVFDNRHLPAESRFSLAQRQIYNLGQRYDRKSGRVDGASKIAPMFGLMGTLIPLGPGITAMGKGDIAALANSLLIAFDTTVVGLIAAAVCFVIARIRKRWYADYLMALKASAAAILEKIDEWEEEAAPSDHSYSTPGNPAFAGAMGQLGVESSTAGGSLFGDSRQAAGVHPAADANPPAGVHPAADVHPGAGEGPAANAYPFSGGSLAADAYPSAGGSSVAGEFMGRHVPASVADPGWQPGLERGRA